MSTEKEEDSSGWWVVPVLGLLIIFFATAIVVPVMLLSNEHVRAFVYNPTQEQVRELAVGDSGAHVVLVDLEESCLSDGTVIIKTVYSVRTTGGKASLSRFLSTLGVDYSVSGNVPQEERR